MIDNWDRLAIGVYWLAWLDPPIDTAQTLAPDAQDGSFRISDILASPFFIYIYGWNIQLPVH